MSNTHGEMENKRDVNSNLYGRLRTHLKSHSGLLEINKDNFFSSVYPFLLWWSEPIMLRHVSRLLR